MRFLYTNKETPLEHIIEGEIEGNLNKGDYFTTNALSDDWTLERTYKVTDITDDTIYIEKDTTANEIDCGVTYNDEKSYDQLICPHCKSEQGSLDDFGFETHYTEMGIETATEIHVCENCKQSFIAESSTEIRIMTHVKTTACYDNEVILTPKKQELKQNKGAQILTTNIQIKKHTETCFSMNDVNAITVIMETPVKNNHKIILDFDDVSIFTTLFFNHLLMPHLLEMGPTEYNNVFQIKNLSEIGANTYKHSYENAISIYEKNKL